MNLDKKADGHQGEDPGARDARTTTFAHIGTSALVARETIVPTSGAQVTKSYAYDANGHRISMTRSEGATTEVFTYGYDVHGSTSVLLDESGNPKASYGYTPYGELDKELSKGDTSENDPFNAYRYSARRFDSGSESIDMGARRFAADSARFLQQDMFMGALADLSLSSDPLTANRYSLAGGNPVGYMEWDGHIPTLDGTAGAVRASEDGGWEGSSGFQPYPNASGGRPIITEDGFIEGETGKLPADPGIAPQAWRATVPNKAPFSRQLALAREELEEAFEGEVPNWCLENLSIERVATCISAAGADIGHPSDRLTLALTGLTWEQLNQGLTNPDPTRRHIRWGYLALGVWETLDTISFLGAAVFGVVLAPISRGTTLTLTGAGLAAAYHSGKSALHTFDCAFGGDCDDH